MRPWMSSRRAVVVLAVCLFGCLSGIKARQVTPAEPNADGLRYFLPAPYLVLSEDAKGQWSAKIELGVDRSREFALSPYNYFANTNASAVFETNGALKSFHLTSDSTKIPQALVDALKEVGLKQLELDEAAIDDEIKAGLEGDKKGVKPTPGARQVLIYRIHGRELIPAPAASIVFEASSNTGGAPPSMVEIQPPAGVTFQADDRKKLKFFDTSDNPLAAGPTKALQDAITPHGQTFLVPRALLDSHDVGRIVLGVAEIWKKP